MMKMVQHEAGGAINHTASSQRLEINPKHPLMKLMNQARTQGKEPLGLARRLSSDLRTRWCRPACAATRDPWCPA
jgi:hypothetical protein